MLRCLLWKVYQRVVLRKKKKKKETSTDGTHFVLLYIVKKFL